MSETLLRSGRRPRDTALIAFLVVLIVGLAAGLRFYELGRQSLWADEGNSAVMAARSLAQIAVSAANDIHPPLYYWLLRLWTQFAGVSEVGLRSLSAVLGALLVLVTIGLGMRLGGTALGLVAGLIAAVVAVPDLLQPGSADVYPAGAGSGGGGLSASGGWCPGGPAVAGQCL